MDAHLALLLVELHLPDAGSLKAKRKDVQSLKAQLRTRFGASAAEVAWHDQWQRAGIAAAVVEATPGRLEERCASVERWVVGRFPDGARVDVLRTSSSELEA